MSRNYLCNFLYKLLAMIWTSMQKFRVIACVDIYKQIFLYLSFYNFVHESTAQV
jgi:hypothetical protein